MLNSMGMLSEEAWQKLRLLRPPSWWTLVICDKIGGCFGFTDPHVIFGLRILRPA